jgi:hypothetical protein
MWPRPNHFNLANSAEWRPVFGKHGARSCVFAKRLVWKFFILEESGGSLVGSGNRGHSSIPAQWSKWTHAIDGIVRPTCRERYVGRYPPSTIWSGVEALSCGWTERNVREMRLPCPFGNRVFADPDTCGGIAPYCTVTASKAMQRDHLMAPNLSASQHAQIQHMIENGAFTYPQIGQAANCSVDAVRAISRNLRDFGGTRAPRNRGGRPPSIT